MVGLFPGAFIGFLIASMFCVGHLKGSEETACGLSQKDKNPVSIEFVSKETGNRVGSIKKCDISEISSKSVDCHNKGFV